MVEWIMDPKTWKYDGDDSQSRRTRQFRRGYIVAMLIGLLQNLGSLLFIRLGADEATIYAVFVTLFTNVLAFILDSAFSSDEGQRTVQEKGIFDSLRNAVSNMSSLQFYKYMTVIAIDVCTSSYLMEHLLVEAKKLKVPPFAKDLPFVLVSLLISNIVFFSYSNNMRVNWALQPDAVDDNNNIDDLYSLIAVVISSSYLVQEQREHNILESRRGRIVTSLCIMILVSLINNFSGGVSLTVGILNYVIIATVTTVICSLACKEANALVVGGVFALVAGAPLYAVPFASG
jgi:hypothetical protein